MTEDERPDGTATPGGPPPPGGGPLGPGYPPPGPGGYRPGPGDPSAPGPYTQGPYTQGPYNQGPGPFPPPGYGGYPGYGYGAPAPTTNTRAIVSLITGILSIIMCPVTGLVGLYTGFSARKQIRESQGTEGGDGLAVAGIITSFVGVFLIGLVFVSILAVTFLGRSASSKFSSIATPIYPTPTYTSTTTRRATSSTSIPASSGGGSATAATCAPATPSVPAAGRPTVTAPAPPPPTTLQTTDLTVGTGAEAKAGDRVTVQYVGVAASNGKEFDASWNRAQPFTFTLGEGMVIEGWDQGVAGMRVGGRRQLVIPPRPGLRLEGHRQRHRTRRDVGLRGRPRRDLPGLTTPRGPRPSPLRLSEPTLVPERDVDPAEIYEQERLAFVALLRTRPETDLRTAVPATPAWSVRDVLAHLVGINADLNAQRFGDGGGDEWTAAQIASRRDASLEAMAAEWDREAPTFEAGLRLFGYGFGAHYLGDLLQHVGDVHAALGVPPARDDEPLAVALDFYLQSFEETVTDAHLGAVEVRVTASTGTETFTLGQGEVVATVTAPRWELFRSLGGRRTVGEIRALGWTGEADAVIPFLSRYPLPTAPLAEPRLNP